MRRVPSWIRFLHRRMALVLRPSRRGRRSRRLEVEQLEDRSVPSGQPLLELAPPEVSPAPSPPALVAPPVAGTSPAELAPNGQVQGILGPGQSREFRVTVSQSGRLSARIEATGLDTRLSLLDGTGQLLIQSDGPWEQPLEQHLLGDADGTGYRLRVESRDGTAGAFTLTTAFAAAVSPSRPLPAGDPVYVVTGDLNGDGWLDLAAANQDTDDVSLFLGIGDGTFRIAGRVAVGSGPFSVAAADFDGDGRLDLATANRSPDNDVSILLGRGDGTFEPHRRFAVGTEPYLLVTVDFDGDGRADLATANNGSHDVSILLGRGDGTFGQRIVVAAGIAPFSLTTGDFDQDGVVDIATANQDDNDVSILLGQGDGTFAAQQRFAAGSGPAEVIAGDWDGDRRLDLVTVNPFFDEVSFLRGNGDGSFRAPVAITAGSRPFSVIGGDFDADGRLDLATPNRDSGDVSVMLGMGDGTFQPQRRFAAGIDPFGLAVGDFDADGRLDLAVANTSSNDLTILLGNGDGTFAGQTRLSVHGDPEALAVADFDGDNRLDLAAATLGTNEVALLISTGDGAFRVSRPVSVQGGPIDVAAADFNSDGRPDLATANNASNEVAILLGLGDGTFQPPVYFAAGDLPMALAAGDFDGDGVADLAVANQRSGTVSILIGVGDGTFRNATSWAVGDDPLDLVAADFDGDGRLDLATANSGSHDGSILMGLGDGTFRSEGRFSLGEYPNALLAADFNEDGRTDLASSNLYTDDVSVVLGNGDGSFRTPLHFATALSPEDLTTNDFNGDGHLDLATVHLFAVYREVADVSMLYGNGDGTFQSFQGVSIGGDPRTVASADFNGDRRADLAVGLQDVNAVAILVGNGSGSFMSVGQAATPLRSTPHLADLNGDQILDTAVLNREGQILIRYGRPGMPGVFDSPVVVDADPDFAARDLAVVHTPAGVMLAALNARHPAFSLYVGLPGRSFVRRATLGIPGQLPVVLAAGDLNGDRFDDLAVASAVSGTVQVYLQRDGRFQGTPDQGFAVGLHPSALLLSDTNADGRLDILAVNQLSGDISVRVNDSQQPFASELRFRSGTGPHGLQPRADRTTGSSLERPVGVVAGDFDGDRLPDLVSINAGTNRFSLLAGTGSGYLDPVSPPSFATGTVPSALVSGDWNGDRLPDLAILNVESQNVSIYLGDGTGEFVPGSRLNVGLVPAGLASHDVNRDGRLDLVVGNEFGDVLTLQGKGDGTFQAYQRIDRQVGLAVADLNRDGKQDVVLANQELDRVSVQFSRAGQSFVQDRTNGLLGPETVQLADLNRDGWQDMVVANSGANNVLVYLGQGDGQFQAAQSFFAGTNPTGITLADVNADGLTDVVVANEGSNDVSVLLGNTRGLLAPGPRLQTNQGPVSTTVRDVTSDGLPDLLVANRQANNVSLLEGLGSGFFDDQSPRTFATGVNPVQVLAENFDDTDGLDLVSVNAGSDDLTFMADFLTAAGTTTSITAGGTRPQAAVAEDVDGDGQTDLLVANNGSGTVTLFVSHTTGLTLSSTYTTEKILNPTSLALSTLDTGSFEVFVAGEGQESVARFSLDTGSSSTATLSSLPDATVIAVATLLNGGEEPPTLPVLPSEEVLDLPLSVIGLDAASLRDSSVGLADTPPTGGTSELRGEVLAALDRLYRDWLPTLVENARNTGETLAELGSDWLTGAASVVGTAGEMLGLPELEMPGERLQAMLRDLTSGFLQAIGGTVRELALPGRSPTLDTEVVPAPTTPGIAPATVPPVKPAPSQPPNDDETEEPGFPLSAAVLVSGIWYAGKRLGHSKDRSRRLGLAVQLAELDRPAGPARRGG